MGKIGVGSERVSKRKQAQAEGIESSRLVRAWARIGSGSDSISREDATKRVRAGKWAVVVRW